MFYEIKNVLALLFGLRYTLDSAKGNKPKHQREQRPLCRVVSHTKPQGTPQTLARLEHYKQRLQGITTSRRWPPSVTATSGKKTRPELKGETQANNRYLTARQGWVVNHKKPKGANKMAKKSKMFTIWNYQKPEKYTFITIK